MDEYRKRMAGINLTGGATNCVEIAADLYDAASFDRMLASYQRAKDSA